MGHDKQYCCDFEIRGQVEGVFFKTYALEAAKRFQVTGWCINTPHGTVKGYLEGPVNQMKKMVKWLQETGSPSSTISKALFTEFKEIKEKKCQGFSIKQ